MNRALYRPDIDGLRAVAIVAVVLFHTWPTRVPGGFVGVDVFFVISGFLITGIIVRGLDEARFSFSGFYANRIKRIVPALAVVLLVCLLYGWFELMPRDYAQLGKHVDAAAGFSENFVLWDESGYFDAAAQHKPLLHLWSLAIEEQFYLFYPTLVCAAWRLGRGRSGVAVAAFAVISFALNIATVEHNSATAFYMPHTRVWELFAGGILALSERRSARGRHVLSIMGMGLIATAIVGFDSAIRFPGWAALMPVAGTVLVLHAGPDAVMNRIALRNPVAVGIGLISYPLYLWHWPLLAFADTSDVATWPYLRGTLVVASVILAWATYRYVEFPFRFGPRSNRFKVSVLVGATAIAAVFGTLIYSVGGFDSRLPPEIRAIATWEYDYTTDARYPACWLSDTTPFDQFGTDCWGGLRASRGGDTLVVWGDSHGARLYPGITRAFPRMDVAQFTRNSCAPILSATTSLNCRVSNERVLEALVRYKPKRVLLVSAWQQHGLEWGVTTDLGRGLSIVLDRLHDAGISDVIVVGPAPQWRDVLTTLIAKAYAAQHEVPRRLPRDLVIPEVREVDEKLAALVHGRDGARYFSVLNNVCTVDGCLAFASDSPTSYFSWDVSHLTTDGATFVAQRLGL